MKRALDILFTSIDAICRLLLLFLTVSVLTTVFGRYVLNMTPRWGEELALTLIVWLSLLAVPVGLRNGWHIRLDLLQRVIPDLAKRGLGVFDWILSMVFAVMFVWYGIKLAVQNLSNLMPGLGISAFWQYLSVPVSGTLIIIALLEMAWRHARPAPKVEGAPN